MGCSWTGKHTHNTHNKPHPLGEVLQPLALPVAASLCEDQSILASDNFLRSSQWIFTHRRGCSDFPFLHENEFQEVKGGLIGGCAMWTGDRPDTSWLRTRCAARQNIIKLPEGLSHQVRTENYEHVDPDSLHQVAEGGVGSLHRISFPGSLWRSVACLTTETCHRS